MSEGATQQWKCVVGRVLKGSVYVLGPAAFALAFLVSQLVKVRVGAAVVDDELSRPVAFAASFLVYLCVIGVAALVCHFVLWRGGAHLTTQTQEPPWQTKPRTRRAVPLTQTTPVP